MYVCLCACLHIFVKHIASCRPGEVMCGNGQCKPQSSQCVSQSSCADSSEEGTCGEWDCQPCCAGTCLYDYRWLKCVCCFQEVNVTMCAPIRSVCPSLQCAMVLLTAKTAVMSSTAQEHVSCLFIDTVCTITTPSYLSGSSLSFCLDLKGCPASSYKCANGKCLSKTNPECDGVKDCFDSSDEQRCGKVSLSQSCHLHFRREF